MPPTASRCAAEIRRPEIVERVEKARMGLAGYFNRLIQARRGQTGDDLLSVLIAAEEEGDRLSPEELLIQSIGLLIAGFETTIGLIGNGLTTLIRNPGEIARLRAQPELIESAVEECLRYSGPITWTVRILHEPAEFGGYALDANEEVAVGLAAANRDPEHVRRSRTLRHRALRRDPRTTATSLLRRRRASVSRRAPRAARVADRHRKARAALHGSRARRAEDDLGTLALPGSGAGAGAVPREHLSAPMIGGSGSRPPSRSRNGTFRRRNLVSGPSMSQYDAAHTPRLHAGVRCHCQ